MRRKLVRILMPLFMAAVLLAGCQKAPETADDDEILRAKGSSDDAVEGGRDRRRQSEREGDFKERGGGQCGARS